MTESAKDIALRLIRRPDGACATSFLEAGVGVRYSARIHELRAEGWPIITVRRCDAYGHNHPRPTPTYRMADDDWLEADDE